MDKKITKIEAVEVKDSRGNPTILVTVWIGEKSGAFAVPSGASTGKKEAHVLPVPEAIEKIKNIIAPALIGQNSLNQEVIDRIMLKLDGTQNKSRLGANAMIGVSIACAKAAARASFLETFEYLQTLRNIKSSRKVPYLFMNLINGGKHAKNGLAFQEYLLVPETDDAEEAVKTGKEIYDLLGKIVKKDLGIDFIPLGDEGGYAPQVSDVQKPFYYLKDAVLESFSGKEARFALDAAASSFFDGENYEIQGEKISKEKLSGIYKSLIKKFDPVSIEDPFDEGDFESFRRLKKDNSKIFSRGLLVVGDDLTVTNRDLLEKAVNFGSINAMIIKPNQIGTLTETLDAMETARKNGVDLIVSHRSGETMDDFIADLAFAFGCFGLKAGAPLKPERKVKYDRLIAISKK